MNLKNISIQDRNAIWVGAIALMYYAGLEISLNRFRDKETPEEELQAIEAVIEENDEDSSTVNRKNLYVLKY